MPNHIKNRITINGPIEQIGQVVETFGTYSKASLSLSYDNNIICREINSDKWSVGWFNPKTGEFTRRDKPTLIGLPEGWEFEINDSYFHFPNFEKIIPPPENIFRGNLGEKERIQCEKEGRPNWYDWNYENWGTKWNSYACEKEKLNVYTFETAWAGVPSLVLKMSEKFPEVEFLYEYADEDTGSNVGKFVFKNGEVLQETKPQSGSKEAYELAFTLRPDCREDYEEADGTYLYKEENV